MFPAQLSQSDLDKLMRCRDSSQLVADEQKGHNENTKADAALADAIDAAIWKDGILRALDYNNIEIRVKNRTVSLYGHVTSLTNRHQAENAIRSVDGILGIKNHLIPDDRLLAEVATALGALEHTYSCKFFTGVSHGVVLLSGYVDDAETKLLAEKCAASNPNVRAVINSVRIRGHGPALQDQPFLQPSIGVEIFFLDGISGRVGQVVINPDNRRVIAMTLQGRFADQQQELKSLNSGTARPPERTLVLPMRAVRHLTRNSGFLNIRSNEREHYTEFDPADFSTSNKDWSAPYPYCPDDVLFPAEQHVAADQFMQQLQSPFALALEHQVLREQLLENDSLGG